MDLFANYFVYCPFYGLVSDQFTIKGPRTRAVLSSFVFYGTVMFFLFLKKHLLNFHRLFVSQAIALPPWILNVAHE